MQKDNVIMVDLIERVERLEKARKSDEKMWALAAKLLKDNLRPKPIAQKEYDDHYKQKLKEKKEEAENG